ncbi:MAG: NAD-glutamate dehydrogenase domain-containing protein [Ferrimicrobium sp.]
MATASPKVPKKDNGVHTERENTVYTDLSGRIEEVQTTTGTPEEIEAVGAFVKCYTAHVEPEEEAAFSVDFLLQAVSLQWHTMLVSSPDDICSIEVISRGRLARANCHADGTVRFESDIAPMPCTGTLVSIVSLDMAYLVDTFLQTLRSETDHITTLHPIIETAALGDCHFGRIPNLSPELISFFSARLTADFEPIHLETIIERLASRYRQLYEFNQDRDRMFADLINLVEHGDFPVNGSSEISPTTSAFAYFIPMAELRHPNGSLESIPLGIKRPDVTVPSEWEKGSEVDHRVLLLRARSEILEDTPLRAISFRTPEGTVDFLGLFKPSRVGSIGLVAPEIADRIATVCSRLSLLATSHSYRLLQDFVTSLNIDTVLALPTSEFQDLCKLGLLVEEVARVQVYLAHTASELERLLIIVPGDRLEAGVEDTIDQLIALRVPTMIGRTARTFSKRRLVLEFAVDESLSHADLENLREALDQATTPWKIRISTRLRERLSQDDLTSALALLEKLATHLDSSYKIDIEDDIAIEDIIALHRLVERDGALTARLSITNTTGVRLHLITVGMRLALSDMLPVIENLGFSVVDELPYHGEVDGQEVWIIDLGLRPLVEGIDSVIAQAHVAERLEAFLSLVWVGETFNDQLNQLAITADLSVDEIEVLRALAAYLRLGTLGYSENFCRAALVSQPAIARSLAKLLWSRFDPTLEPDERDTRSTEWRESIEAILGSVASLDHDKVLRSIRTLIDATTRTNLFQTGRTTIAFKFDPSKIPFLPRPLPQFEIYLHSLTTEAVHLRGGPVARGGIRFSDRTEDFRTEILGLMKAQSVKNAVIVPVGAKGGFIVKDLDPKGPNAERIERSYRTFMTTLLSLTDNLILGEIVPPIDTVRYDGDDHYLVVAADKGTAAFSDIANEISLAHGFWLGDAFASGGSHGFDHKKMGITAKGAWVSVAHHFDALGIDLDETDITVVGIGDLSGDVFGNGMLRSRHLRLVAAFDHRHIFLDPSPNAARSWEVRKILVEQGPGTSWADYPSTEISEGGGVFPRTLKKIPITSEVAEILGIEAVSLEPNELIRAILRAPVDLLFNGGIGTYVKASSESQVDAADKGNDAVRVDGGELRTRVIGEGGNLGMTQLGRIEYGLAGGRCNTDSIDNSAGVDTSDHEVNIKIALDAIVAEGQLDPEDRNKLLIRCTPEVENQTLSDNIYQNWTLSAAELKYANAWEEIARLLAHLVHSVNLDPKVEYLPIPSQTTSNPPNRRLTRAEFAIIISYAKADLNQLLHGSDLLDHPLTSDLFRGYFPDVLDEVLADATTTHPLRREIISTSLANLLVNHVGIFGIPTIATVGGIDHLHAAEFATIAIWLTDATSAVTSIQSNTAIPYELRIQAYLDLQNLLVATALDLRLAVANPAELFDTEVITNLRERVAAITTELAKRDDIQWEGWRSRSEALANAGFTPDVVSLIAPGRTLASIIALQLNPKCHDKSSGIEAAIVLLQAENASGIAAAKIALAGRSVADLTSLLACQAIEDRLNRFAHTQLIELCDGADHTAIAPNDIITEITRNIDHGTLLAALLACLRLDDPRLGS